MRISDWSSDVCSSDLQLLGHLPQVEHRLEGLCLLQQAIDQLAAGDHRQRRDVVDRLLRIELGALTAGLVLDVDDVGLEAQQAELERSEEHTSELQSLMRISYAVFCLKKKNSKQYTTQ